MGGWLRKAENKAAQHSWGLGLAELGNKLFSLNHTISSSFPSLHHLPSCASNKTHVIHHCGYHHSFPYNSHRALDSRQVKPPQRLVWPALVDLGNCITPQILRQGGSWCAWLIKYVSSIYHVHYKIHHISLERNSLIIVPFFFSYPNPIQPTVSPLSFWGTHIAKQLYVF